MDLATLRFENKLWREGYQYIAGVDEVGRGSWAGPVVAAAVILPQSWHLPPGLADSKLLSPRAREDFAEIITAQAVSYHIAEVGLPYINREGIGRAAQRAFRLAVRGLVPEPDFHLVDAFYIKYLPKSKQLPIIKGDRLSASIAAASIIAKVYRDRLMQSLSTQFPEYGFGHHKGYGTREHQAAIRDYGLSEIHRQSFNLTSWLPSYGH